MTSQAASNVAKIMAADAISARFKPTQALGSILAGFLPAIHGSSAFEGFTYFSAELCHELKHGKGTCSKFLSRDDSCLGK